jgi:hypothetical protein
MKTSITHNPRLALMGSRWQPHSMQMYFLDKSILPTTAFFMKLPSNKSHLYLTGTRQENESFIPQKGTESYQN